MSIKGLLFRNPASAHYYPVTIETDQQFLNIGIVQFIRVLGEDRIKWKSSLKYITRVVLPCRLQNDMINTHSKVKYHLPPSLTKDSRQKKKNGKRVVLLRCISRFNSTGLWRWCLIFRNTLLPLNFDHRLLHIKTPCFGSRLRFFHQV